MCSRSALTVLALLGLVLPLRAQAGLDESRRRLEDIRRERALLEQDRVRLQGQVHDQGQELDNL